MAVSDHNIQRMYRVRIIIFFGSTVLMLLTSAAAYEIFDALRGVAAVERSRDQWQEPDAIIRSLDIRNGDVVADVGCGVGYFTTKLSSVVGRDGTVLAVDVRPLALAFLRLRTLLIKANNVIVVQSQADNPTLMTNSVDAILVVNTWHEFGRPKEMLAGMLRALRPGGRLVVADRGPDSDSSSIGETGLHHHELSPAVVEGQLVQSGLELVRRDDQFIHPLNDRRWWLIVVRKTSATVSAPD